jgi:hypothetical protein
MTDTEQSANTPSGGPPVIVVGAGIAGLACAQALLQAGRAVRVLEKSRGLGGRVATRRRDGIEADHGAPFAEVMTPAFRAATEAWAEAGVAGPWGAEAAVVGLTGMSALARPLSTGLEITREARVAGLTRTEDGWSVEVAEGAQIAASAVVLAIPAPQAVALLRAQAAAFPGLDAVTMDPCWTVLAGFDAPLPGPDRIEGDGAPLAKALRNTAKPGRPPSPDVWVLHAGADWTRAHLDSPPDAAATALETALAERLGVPVRPDRRMVHRWLYAHAAERLAQPCGWHPALRLGLAGDWCAQPEVGVAGVEAAFLSGTRLAARMLEP